MFVERTSSNCRSLSPIHCDITSESRRNVSSPHGQWPEVKISLGRDVQKMPFHYPSESFHGFLARKTSASLRATIFQDLNHTLRCVRTKNNDTRFSTDARRWGSRHDVTYTWLDSDFIQTDFDAVVYRWNKCLDKHGDYVEKHQYNSTSLWNKLCPWKLLLLFFWKHPRTSWIKYLKHNPQISLIYKKV